MERMQRCGVKRYGDSADGSLFGEKNYRVGITLDRDSRYTGVLVGTST